MSTFEIKAYTIDKIEPHSNAERLDLVVLGGYRCVVAKGSKQLGERVVYLPTDAVVPAPVAEHFGIATYLAGREKNRVKAIKLRGVLSEGIVLCEHEVLCYLGRIVPLTDYAEALGITKYEEPIPVSMMGQARHWPLFVPKYDIESYKKPEFQGFITAGTSVAVMEKLHGTNTTVAWGPGLEQDEEAFVCSRNFALKEDAGNLYWRAARRYQLIDALHVMRLAYEGEHADSVESISLHGEIVGVQDLTYGATKAEPKFYAFDVMVNGHFVPWPVFRELCQVAGVPVCPVLYEGPFDPTRLEEWAEGATTIPGATHIREGVVIRTAKGTRMQLKYVSGSYLTRSGGTELH